MGTCQRPLDMDAIRTRITGDVGSRLLYFPEIGSTNAELLRLPHGQMTHGLIAITDYQSAGRGRMERTWVAPRASSLLFSVALDWPADIPVAQSVMLAALAVGDALQAVAGLASQLKWPNDVL